MPIELSSDAFVEGGTIPREFTCDGADVSPPLSWTHVPEKARSLAIICEDPDAPGGIWTHWLLFDLAPDVSSLPRGVAPAESLPHGGRQGTNDFGRLGYGGPCPPSGTHRYVFKLFALDARLGLAGRVSRKKLLKAMEGHVLESAILMGRYAR